MNVYEAAEVVKAHFQKTITENIVQTQSIYGYCKGQIIKFKNKSDAGRLDGGNGFLFECAYSNGQIEVTPFT